jgi:SpoVK/Ycf46/Vps4 family AAA+-type ATPase
MFIGNELKYYELVQWLTTGTSEHVCIVSGITGCGKTYGIKRAIENTGKMLIVFDSSNCLNGKEFIDKYTKTTRSNIVAQFAGIQGKDTVVFIDELDAFIALDRTFLTSLKTVLSLTHGIKTVLACTPELVKRIDIPCKQVKLNIPREADVVIFLKSFHRCSSKELVSITEMCCGNLSVALQALARPGGAVDKFPEIASIYRQTGAAEQVFMLDLWLNPLRFHENLVHEFKQRIKRKDTPKVYEGIMGDLCLWDVMMSRGLCEIAPCFMALSVRKLDKLVVKKTAAPPNADFTRLINMLSIRKKNLNALYTSIFPWGEVGSYEKSFLNCK